MLKLDKIQIYDNFSQMFFFSIIRNNRPSIFPFMILISSINYINIYKSVIFPLLYLLFFMFVFIENYHS